MKIIISQAMVMFCLTKNKFQYYTFKNLYYSNASSNSYLDQAGLLVKIRTVPC